MCCYDLPICPHPHPDPVVNLVLNPARQDEWQQCEAPRPWGRLSCGSLTVRHQALGIAEECAWCTLALKASISKFKSSKEEHKKLLDLMGKMVSDDVELTQLDAEIATKEAELEELRRVAWMKRNALLRKGSTAWMTAGKE